MNEVSESVEEMVQALGDELAAIHKKRDVHKFPIEGGVRGPDTQVYVCAKGRRKWLPLSPGDDVTLVLTGGRELAAEFLAQTLDDLHIRLAQDVGPTLPEGHVVTDLSWILKQLGKSLDRGQHVSSIAAAVIQPSKVETTGIAYPVDGPIGGLNPDQELAIAHGLAPGLTALWGPPGTGKTTTLAHMARESLERRESMLLVAASNSAVDELALAIDNVLLDWSGFDDQLVVRLGTVSDPELRRRQAANTHYRHTGEGLRYPIQVWPGPVDDRLRAQLQSASIVVTTLPRCWISGGLKRTFDTAVLDEASVATIPAAYELAKYARRSLVIGGDYRQLGPIVHSRTASAQRWLVRDIWDLHAIPAALERDDEPDMLVVLPTQYRMARPIMELVSETWYGGRLLAAPSCPTTPRYHPLLGSSNMVLVDTSGCPVLGRRRFEHSYHARIAAAIGESLAVAADTVGVITRHRDQVGATRRELRGARPGLSPRVDTVHGFQGSEADTVILDVTAAPHLWGGDWITAREPRSPGDRLLCVASSRARTRLIVLANVRHLMSTAPRGGTIMTSLLRRIAAAGTVIPAGDVLRGLSIRAA